jgi:rubrerythrin
MIIQRAITHTTITASRSAAVQEAMHILAETKPTHRWVCEVCGMLHTGSAPRACDCCGSADALVPDHDTPREINSRW